MWCTGGAACAMGIWRGAVRERLVEWWRRIAFALVMPVAECAIGGTAAALRDGFAVRAAGQSGGLARAVALPGESRREWRVRCGFGSAMRAS